MTKSSTHGTEQVGFPFSAGLYLKWEEESSEGLVGCGPTGSRPAEAVDPYFRTAGCRRGSDLHLTELKAIFSQT